MSFTTYSDKYVFDLFPLWTQEPEIEINFPIEKLQGLGVDYQSLYVTYPVFAVKNKYVFKDRASITEMNDLFDLMLGRYGNLWIPSWQKDIDLTVDIGATDTTINIENIDYSTYYPATPGTGRYLFFYLRKGQWFIKKVTGVPSSTQLTIESALGQAVAKSNRVSFLYFVRFDLDEIEWEYFSPNAAELTLFFRELPNEYPT